VGVFDNPANADLLELLEAEAEPTMSHDLDGYELHALPEVCDRLTGRRASPAAPGLVRRLRGAGAGG
jgi:hypothetical protein